MATIQSAFIPRPYWMLAKSGNLWTKFKGFRATIYTVTRPVGYPVKVCIACNKKNCSFVYFTEHSGSIQEMQESAIRLIERAVETHVCGQPGPSLENWG
jgi:hypothetical protein